MENPIKQIIKWNKDAGLLEAGYDDYRESSFQIEEALEGINTEALGGALGNNQATPKELSRMILSMCEFTVPLEDVDRLDKACDAIVFGVGSIAKLGLNTNQTTRALNIVMKANNQKLLNKSVDSKGKLIKDKSTFINPEPELQKILDENK